MVKITQKQVSMGTIVLGIIVSVLSLIQGLFLRYEWNNTYMGFHAPVQIALSVLNVLFSFIFYTACAYEMGPVTALAAIPFGQLVFYGGVNMWFYNSSTARTENAATAYFTNFAFSLLMIVAFFCSAWDLSRYVGLGTYRDKLEQQQEAAQETAVAAA
jgi:hypothetical protein